MNNQEGTEQADAASIGPAHPALEPALSLTERLELALEAANDAVAWTDADGRVQWCNARFAAITLRPREEILGSALVDLLPLEPTGGRPPAEHPVLAVLKGRSMISACYALNRAMGATYWQLAGSWVTPTGKAPMAVFWLHEVTPQVLAERVANRLAAIHAVTQEAVVCWDLDGSITHWNPAAERTYGYGAEEAVGMPFSMLVPKDGRTLLDDILSSVRKGEGPIPLETNQKRKDNRAIRVRGTLTGWSSEDGRLCGFVHVARDITEQRRTEAGLAHQMEEIIRSNRQLAEFSSSVSHDLLEPLRKIIAFGGLLEKQSSQELDEQGRDFLGRITAAASRMTKLIEDLLQFSRVFGDRLPLESIDLSAVVSEVLSDLEIRIAETKAVIEVAALPTIRAHPSQMRQLFQNLIANAIKFRDTARPPRVAIASSMERPGLIDISVRDNGIGFDQKDAEKIFEPFIRLHTRTEYEGSGIGLAVCRRIVLRHGGWISAESVQGSGSTFTISLPAQEGKDEDPSLGT